MATFARTEKNIGYLNVSYDELQSYSQLPMLVCDDCNAGLLPKDEIIVIPILNMAYCEKCSPDKLQSVNDYPEDRQVRERRERFWCDFYGVQYV